jgi:hypothetical protein
MSLLEYILLNAASTVLCHIRESYLQVSKQITVTNEKPYIIQRIYLTADLSVESEKNKKQFESLGRTNILKQNSPMFPKYCPVSKYL